MADSIRQQIMDKVDARLKLIKTTGGYKTNIGSHVFDWLTRDLADSDLDALIYRDKANSISAGTQKLFENRVSVEIEVKSKSASTTAKQVRMMIEDVYKAIGTDETWGGLAQKTNVSGDSIEIEQGEKVVGSGTINIEIEYRTAKWSY